MFGSLELSLTSSSVLNSTLKGDDRCNSDDCMTIRTSPSTDLGISRVFCIKGRSVVARRKWERWLTAQLEEVSKELPFRGI